MESVVGAANWLLGKLLRKLSEDMVAAYVATLELGHNFQDIQRKLLYTQGLLHAAQGRDVSDNPGLHGLLQQLSSNADKAEDALDELHYFKIQDDLDGTQEATVQEPGPEIGDVVRAHARHGRHAVRYTVGNCLQCFSCSPTKDEDCVIIDAATSNPHNTTNSDNHSDGGHVGRLPFNRVEMSLKIKSIIEEIHSLCALVSDLLSKIPNNSTTVPLTRPQRGSAIVQDKLYGREVIFERSIDDVTSCNETLSVLPVVGPGGIGKTTFTQHLYNDTRTKKYFDIRVWVCVSTDFDVFGLTKQILSCIPATEKQESSTAHKTSNLSKLQEYVAARLESKRFLLVLDDIWKCDSREDWETLLAPFTKGGANGSMILVTTRFPKLAEMMRTVDPVELKGLESTDFFTFFESCIFGEDQKPLHYEDDLRGIAKEIANKLKGSPLAAKTVGRLLKRYLTREHWNGVLKNSGWINEKNNDDIMPSLKISYDYLPFDIKKCFSYFSLFPEDHRFNSSEINRFWIAIGVIPSRQQSDRNLLEELVDSGFLMKGGDDADQYYVMHDLMHELCRVVSATECLNISHLDFKADAIPHSVQHLSITIEHKYYYLFKEENRYDGNFREQMGKLKGRIDVASLRTLMIFEGYEGMLTETLVDTFKEINGLRVLFITSKFIESLPHSFSKLIHLQYLKIVSSFNDKKRIHPADNLNLPSTLSRFYHLKFLDLSMWKGSSSLPKDISRLFSLRDFLAEKELHSNISEVGKMKYLQELKEFCVKKERDGFELRELGELTELGGTLSICNLEKVATQVEASAAKLMSKRNLKELRLVWGWGWGWGGEQPTTDADFIDVLKPHSNLRDLHIVNHGGTTGPSWLCLDVWVKNLESLHLESLSWATLPPFWQLPHLKNLSLKHISGLRQFGPDYGGFSGKCFMHLKSVLFRDMPELVKWVAEPNCHMFPRLESIICSLCPKLCVMPFSECSFASLSRLHIWGSPKLSLPPMPFTSTLTDVDFRESEYGNYGGVFGYYRKSMLVQGYNGALAFHNIDKVEHLRIEESLIPLTDGREHNFLCKLFLGRWDNMVPEQLDDSVVLPSVQRLELQYQYYITGNVVSKLLNCFPNLSTLSVSCASQEHVELVIQHPSFSSLQEVSFKRCKGLVLVPAEDGGEAQELMKSFESLTLKECGRIFSWWPMGEGAGGAQTINPLPASLRQLYVEREPSMYSMDVLSNLTSLTSLSLVDCYHLTMYGFNPLITVNLKELKVVNSSRGSIAADLLSEMARCITTMPAGSFQLEVLEVDSISGLLVPVMCDFLASTSAR